MTDMTHERIRDLLPDALHATVDSERRRQIEEHLRHCSECASEMRVLQMVKDAPSFAPMIDAVKVSSKILPYGGIPAARERPSTRRWMQLAAAAAVVMVGVIALTRGTSSAPATPAPAVRVAAAPSSSHPTAATAISRTDSPSLGAVGREAKSHELQVAVGLDDLSDGNIKQLASELDGLDGLPSAEPENVEVTDTNTSGGGQ